MSTMNDLAVVASPTLTFSIMEAFDSSAFGSVALLGAGSPANLEQNAHKHWLLWLAKPYILVRHDDEEPFASIFVRLKLVVL